MNKEYMEENRQKMRVDRTKIGWILNREDIGWECRVDEDMVNDSEIKVWDKDDDKEEDLFPI